MFVAKLDSNGNWLWAKQSVGAETEVATGIVVDNNSTVYLTGYFRGTINFGEYALTCVGRNMFVTKQDSNGNWLWVRSTDSTTGEEHVNASSITTDSNANVYVTGSFRYNAFFGTNTLVNDNGNDDIFVAKLDSNGNWLWARQAGGQSFEMGMDIVVSNNSSIYLTGTFSDSVSLGSIVISACGPSDIFFAWMDINGNWLGAIGAGASSFNMGESIIATANGDIFVSGCFCENASFEGNILSSNGLTDIFIANIEIASPVSDDLGVPTPPFAIVNNYPNPFSKATKIVVEIEDTKDVYELSVYDLRGRKIKTLHSGALPKGESTFTWMADDVQSGNLPAGVYFYKLSNGTTSQTRKLVLVR